jgi:hypothetical protein
MIMKSMASSNGNNCLLHCFAHALFNLPVEKYNAIAQTEGFNNLLANFQSYYELDKKPTLDEINELNAAFAAPLEREAIWGPVLRQLLQKDFPNEFTGTDVQKRESLIRDEVFAEYLKTINVSMTVKHEYAGQDEIKYEAVGGPIFTLNVHHAQAGGGHYSFIYPDDDNPSNEKATAHNEKIKIDESTKLADFNHTKFKEFYFFDFVTDRMAYIKDIVKEAMMSPSDLELPLVGLEPQAKKAEIADQVDDAIKLKAKTKDEAEDAPKVEMVNGFPKAFIIALEEIFSENHLDVKDGFIKVNHEGKQFEIKKEEYGVSFSGPSSSFGDIVKSAKAYDTVLGEGAGVEYELEVGDEAQAIEFLKEMQAGGMSFDSVTSININGKEYGKKETQDFIAQALKLHDQSPEGLGNDDSPARKQSKPQ